MLKWRYIKVPPNIRQHSPAPIHCLDGSQDSVEHDARRDRSHHRVKAYFPTPADGSKDKNRSRVFLSTGHYLESRSVLNRCAIGNCHFRQVQSQNNGRQALRASATIGSIRVRSSFPQVLQHKFEVHENRG
jgi:hypothetical protein